jgi:hypothetical protein
VVRNAVVNGTPAALVRASTYRYGSTDIMDHYVLSRETTRRQDGKTARRQDGKKLWARPGSITRLFSTLAGRGYRSSFAAGRRDAKGYAPPSAAWSRTVRRNLTSWRSPTQLTADRHVRRNCCPRTSQRPLWIPVELLSQADGAPATKLSSRRSDRMPERDRAPSASCACTVETST